MWKNLLNHFRISFLLNNKKANQFTQFIKLKEILGFISKIRESLLYQIGFLRSSTNIFLLSNVFIVNYDYVVYYTLLVFILCFYFICLLIVNNHESVEETINNEISLSLQLKEVFKFVTLFFKIIKQYVYILVYNFRIFYFRIKNKKNIVLRQDAGLVFLGLIAIYLGTYIYEYMFLSDIEVFIKNFDESYKLYCLANGIEYDSFRQNTQYAYWRMSHKAQTYSIWTIRSILIGFGSYMVFSLVKAKFDGDPKDPRGGSTSSSADEVGTKLTKLKYYPSSSNSTSSEGGVGVLQQFKSQTNIVDIMTKRVVDNLGSRTGSNMMTPETPGTVAQYILSNVSVARRQQMTLSDFNRLLENFLRFLENNRRKLELYKELINLESKVDKINVELEFLGSNRDPLDQDREEKRIAKLKEHDVLADKYNSILFEELPPLKETISKDLDAFSILLKKFDIPASKLIVPGEKSNNFLIFSKVLDCLKKIDKVNHGTQNKLISNILRIELFEQSEKEVFKLSDTRSEIVNKFRWDFVLKELTKQNVKYDIDHLKAQIRSDQFWAQEMVNYSNFNVFLKEQEKLINELEILRIRWVEIKKLCEKIKFSSNQTVVNSENLSSLDLTTLTSNDFYMLLEIISDNYF